MKPFPAAAALAAVIAAAAAIKALEVTLPTENIFLKPSALPGYAVASGSCVTCHSSDYIRYQPREPRKFWEAEVQKMRKFYGAPIPASAVDPIVDYLEKTYGTEAASPTDSPGK